MTPSDEQHMRAAAKGDMEAFSEIVNGYTEPIYAFIYRLVGNAQDAEDITQNTFIKLWRSARMYREERPVRPWVFSIARHAAIDFLRKRKISVFSDMKADEEEPFEDTVADTEPLPDERAIRSENAQLLEDALRMLPPSYREVVLLHDNDGFTFEEIGSLTDEPLNTVKSRYRRALIKLRNILHAP